MHVASGPLRPPTKESGHEDCIRFIGAHFVSLLQALESVESYCVQEKKYDLMVENLLENGYCESCVDIIIKYAANNLWKD